MTIEKSTMENEKQNTELILPTYLFCRGAMLVGIIGRNIPEE